MAAFLGYLVQSTPLVSGEHLKLPYKGYTAGLTPPEQWDAIPLVGKAQIFILIGMLESYGEILDVHVSFYKKNSRPFLLRSTATVASRDTTRRSKRTVRSCGLIYTIPLTGSTRTRIRSGAASARSTTAA